MIVQEQSRGQGLISVIVQEQRRGQGLTSVIVQEQMRGQGLISDSPGAEERTRVNQ